MSLQPLSGDSIPWRQEMVLGLALIAVTHGAGMLFLGLCGGFGYPLTGLTGAAAMMLALVMTGKRRVGMFFLALGCLGTSFFSGFGMRYQVAVWSGERLIGIPASELANHPEVTYAEFTDAKVFSDQAFTHRYFVNHPKGKQSAHTCTVAPLATVDWTPARPVPAWVAIVDDTTNADWEKPLQRAGLFDVMSGRDPRDAVAQAMVEHGLNGSDRAPILKWGADPETEARQWFQRAALFTALTALPWALAILRGGMGEAFAKKL